MESKLEDTVTYLQFIDCTLDAAKQNEKLQNRPPQRQWGSLFMPTYRPINQNDIKRWQIALALISYLEVNGAIEW